MELPAAQPRLPETPSARLRLSTDKAAVGQMVAFDHMPSRSGVYRLTNLATGDFYVGASSDLWSRAKTHAEQLRCGSHDNQKLQASYQEHGPSIFRIEVLQLVSERLLAKTEQQWIRRLDPRFNKVFRERLTEIPCAESAGVPVLPPDGRMSREARRVRRQEMADAVRGGETTASVAVRYGVTQTTVGAACKEHGVPLRWKR